MYVNSSYPVVRHADQIQNRVTAHSATADWSSGERRHLARITPQAEVPYETPYVKESVGRKA